MKDMQGAVEGMHEAVRSLDETMWRLKFARVKERVLTKHEELFRRLAEHDQR